MYIQQVGQGVVVFIEQVFVERGAGDDLAAMKRQVFQNGILARRQRDRFAGAPDGASPCINAHVPEIDVRLRLPGGSADEGPYPCQQFWQVEWLDQIVV